MGKEYPRKMVFIDRKFQAGFMLKFLLLIMIGTAVFDVAAYFILNRQLGDTFWSAHVAVDSVSEILLPRLIQLSILFILVLGSAALVITLYVSQKFSGPLFAISRYLENIGHGKLDFTAKLRARDQSASLARSLTHTVDLLNERLAAIKSLAVQIGDSSQQLKSNLNQEQLSPTDLRAEADRLASLGLKLMQETEFFQTKRSQEEE